MAGKANIPKRELWPFDWAATEYMLNGKVWLHVLVADE